ncbi:hypothetical protein NHF46_07765 [Arthrobacter alpinus]|nr:hypothetical protein [Arthrobacter alpinus]
MTEGADGLAAAIAQRPWAFSVVRDGAGSLEVSVRDVFNAQHDIPGLVAAQHAGLIRFEAGSRGSRTFSSNLSGT